MRWINLKSNKCPLCSNSDLDFSGLKILTCKKCNFRISHERFNQIVSDMNEQKVERGQPERLKNGFDRFDDFSGKDTAIDEDDFEMFNDFTEVEEYE